MFLTGGNSFCERVNFPMDGDVKVEQVISFFNGTGRTTQRRRRGSYLSTCVAFFNLIRC